MIDLLQAGLRIGRGNGGGDVVEGDSTNDVIFVIDHDDDDDDSDHNSITPVVDRFIFVSESCLPVVTLAEMEMALFGPPRIEDEDNTVNNDDDDSKPHSSSTSAIKPTTTIYEKSWINAISSPNNGYALQYQWNAINNNASSSSSSSSGGGGGGIPASHIWKADQWVMLTRAHASAILSLPDKYLGGRQLYPEFKKCRASDEMYIPTALSILGILHRPNGIREVAAAAGDVDNAGGNSSSSSSSRSRMGEESCAGEYIRRRRMTYADWSVSAKNPASFTCREWKEVVEKARKEGCLFARKFVRSSSSSLLGRDGKDRKWQRAGDRSSNNSSIDDDGNDGLISVESWRRAVVGEVES